MARAWKSSSDVQGLSEPLSVEWPIPQGLGRLCLIEPTGGEQPHQNRIYKTRILGIDPGGVSGLALYDGRRWLIGETPSDLQLFKILQAWHPNVVVAEQFIPEPGRTVERDSLWAEGVIRLWRMGFTREFVRMIWSNRGNVMAQITDDVLHANGLWVEGMQHGRDAIRHVLHYLINKEFDRRWLEFTKSV